MRAPELVLFATLACAGSIASVAQLPVTPPSSSHADGQTAPADLCPLTVFIDAQGHLYDSRFNGRYRVTEQTLRNDIAGGCKERGQTSSVRIQPSAHTKFGRLKEVLDLIKSVRPDVPVATLTPHEQH